MPDWINTFLKQTEPIDAPQAFRLWSGITTLAGILERRVWTRTRYDRLYPNLYTVLIGDPASGKTNSMREARKTVAGITDFKVGPDNPTKASFLDELDAAVRTINHFVFHAMTVFCEELHVLIPSYDEAFLGDLSNLFDNPDKYNSPRRSAKSLSIDFPTLNILACATPAALDMFPEIAWSQGFASRLMLIWGYKQSNGPIDMFDTERRNYKHKNLIDLNTTFFTELSGEFHWAGPSRLEYNKWFNAGMPPRPEHSKLKNYSGRRNIHVLKLSMISSVSAGHFPTVELSDFQRAQHWLLDAESRMPDVFKAAATKSDDAIMRDMHLAASVEYGRIGLDQRKPIPNRFLANYLSQRVPAERVDHIIKASEKRGFIRRSGIGFDVSWIPNPLNDIAPGG